MLHKIRLRYIKNIMEDFEPKFLHCPLRVSIHDLLLPRKRALTTTTVDVER
jgi:hypothetical protein